MRMHSGWAWHINTAVVTASCRGTSCGCCGHRVTDNQCAIMKSERARAWAQQHWLPRPLGCCLEIGAGLQGQSSVCDGSGCCWCAQAHTHSHAAQSCGSFVGGYVQCGLLTRLESDLTCDCMCMWVAFMYAKCSRCVGSCETLRIDINVWYAHIVNSGIIQIELTNVDKMQHCNLQRDVEVFVWVFVCSRAYAIARIYSLEFKITNNKLLTCNYGACDGNSDIQINSV